MSTILIVEDEHPLRNNLEEMLNNAGYMTMTAENGKEAITKLYEKIPDLILSDIKMPEMDGLELLADIQKKDEFLTIPFIFLTSKSELSDIRTGMIMGAEDYITKPFKYNELLKTIDIRLKRKEINLKPLEELRDKILTKVPHELRNPLITVLGYSQMILDDLEQFSNEEIKEMVGSIAASGSKLHERIEKFLTYTELLTLLKDDNAKSKFKNSATEINYSFVNSALEKIIKKYNRANDLSIYIDESTLKINSIYLSCILRELVDNAFNFTSNGTPVIVLGIDLGRNYILHVSNSGSGMAMNEIYKTNLLVKVNDENEYKHGSGLGLLIVKKITELFGCTYEIKSSIGEFTKINIKIPVSVN